MWIFRYAQNDSEWASKLAQRKSQLKSALTRATKASQRASKSQKAVAKRFRQPASLYTLHLRAKKPAQKAEQLARQTRHGKPSNQKSVKQPTPYTKGVASLTNHGETNSPILRKDYR